MQIQPLVATKTTTPAPLQSGRAYKAELVETLGPNRAIVQIGQDQLEVTFEEGVPKTNTFSIVLTPKADGEIVASVLANVKEEVSSGNEVAGTGADNYPEDVKRLLSQIPPELRAIVTRLIQNGRLPARSEAVEQVARALQGSMRDVALSYERIEMETLDADMLTRLLLAVLDTNEGQPVLPNEPSLVDKQAFVERLASLQGITLPGSLSNEQIETLFEAFRSSRSSDPSTLPETLPRGGRTIAVKEVTERLADVTNTFKQEQRTLIKQLEQLEQLASSAPKQAVLAIEAVHQRLRQLIQRTDALLHTDAKQEKQLTQLLSKLDLASSATQNPDERVRLIRDVKQSLSAFRYMPNHVRLEYVTSDRPHVAPLHVKAGQLQGRLIQGAVEQSQAQLAPLSTTNRPGGTLERSTGTLERSSTATPAKPAATVPERPPLPTRHVLEGVTGSKEASPEAQRLLNFLQLQQHVNRSENGQLSHVLLALPAKVQEIDTGIHVHIQNKDHRDVIDWENNVIYLRLDTPHLGEVGVRVEASDRNLRLTLEHDDAALRALAAPLLERIEPVLQDIGYNQVVTQFKALTKQPQQNSEPNRSTKPETGYDFRI